MVHSSVGANDAASVAKGELLPLLTNLCSLARQDGRREQEIFFGRIRSAIEHSRDPEDLAAPFMELSTCAFLGFDYSLSAQLLIDRILEAAQRLSLTLSAGGDDPLH